MNISGHPSWSFLNFIPNDNSPPLALKTLFLQEVFSRGIYSLGTHNISYAHSDDDVEKLLSCYDEVFPLLSGALSSGDIDNHLRCKPLEPLFKVR